MSRRAREKKRPLAFGTDTYRAGAFERLEDARTLKDQARFALAAYAGGVAVEGMLRSLCCVMSREFDEKHDLRRLASRARDLGLLADAREHDFVGAVQGVARHWHGALRYANNDHYERYLRSTGAIKKRETLKSFCSRFFDTCFNVVKRCESAWQEYRKKS